MGMENLVGKHRSVWKPDGGGWGTAVVGMDGEPYRAGEPQSVETQWGWMGEAQ